MFTVHAMINTQFSTLIVGSGIKFTIHDNVLMYTNDDKVMEMHLFNKVE